jgi:hypothetical protein
MRNSCPILKLGNTPYQIAADKFNRADFVDVAYFEPYYLKDFIAGKKAGN